MLLRRPVGFLLRSALLIALVNGGAALAFAQAPHGTLYGSIRETPEAANDAWPVSSGASQHETFAVANNYGARVATFAAEPLDQMLWPDHFRHHDPADPQRHVGIGQPLQKTSWRNRPFHIGWLYGGLLGDGLVSQQIEQDDDMFGGYQLGWDFDHYWGTELRFGFAQMSLIERQGEPLATAREHFWDLNLLYYPWGDARWRPFTTIGMGAGAFRFQDANGQLFDDILFAIPWGGGVKYYYRPWLALRASVIDYWTFGSQGLETMHNVALTAGVEVHFGGPRTSYFPYDAGALLW